MVSSVSTPMEFLRFMILISVFDTLFVITLILVLCVLYILVDLQIYEIFIKFLPEILD